MRRANSNIQISKLHFIIMRHTSTQTVWLLQVVPPSQAELMYESV